MKLKTKEDYCKELKHKYPHIKMLGDYVNNSTKTKFCCKLDFYEWDSTPSNTLKYGCSVCNGHIMNDYTFKQKMKVKNKKVKVIGNYIDKKTTVKCLCLFCNNEFDGNIQSLLQGSTHRECFGIQNSIKKTKNTEWFKSELNKLYPNSYEVLGE